MAEDETYTAALARKLRLKGGQTALALHAPPEFVAALRQVTGPDGVSESAAGGGYDLVCLFARARAEVETGLPQAIAGTRAGGSLWVMWPKKSSAQARDLDRDSLAALVETLGWGPVASIAVDATWSGLRLRPESEINRQTGR